MDQDLQAWLVANITTANGRIYANQAPRSTEPPYLTRQRISTAREQAHDGPLMIASARFQFTVFGRTHSEAAQIINELQEKMDGFVGTMGGTKVQGVYYEDQQDNYDSDGRVYQIIADYFINYYE